MSLRTKFFDSLNWDCYIVYFEDAILKYKEFVGILFKKFNFTFNSRIK